jgi:hypothetical protein
LRSTSAPHVYARRRSAVLASILLSMAVALAATAARPALGQVPGASDIPLLGQLVSSPTSWEDLYGPLTTPDRVVLTPTADPARSQAVSWRTSTDVEAQVAQLAPLTESAVFKNYGNRSGRNDVITIEATAVGDVDETLHYPMRFFTATFTDLEPETTYLYRVGDGSVSGRDPVTGVNASRANWSEWFEFTTAADGPSDFSLIYYGDAQNDVKEHVSRVFRRAFAQRPEAALVLHAGDLIDYGDRDYEWGEWFHAGGFTTSQINQLVTPGNHEYFRDTGPNDLLNAYWDTQFSYPDNGPKPEGDSAFPEVYEALDRNNVHFVDYQEVRFISLDSNGAAVPAGPSRQAWFDIQAAWLDEVLTDNPNRWTVLYFHHPVFSVSEGRNNTQLRNAWLPVIERHDVDLVLQGHDHTYGRGNRIGDRLGSSELHNGTVYAVSVSGPKMYNVSGQVWTDNDAELRETAQDTQLYQLIDITHDQIRYEAYNAAGQWEDGFTISKNPAGHRIVRDLPAPRR